MSNSGGGNGWIQAGSASRPELPRDWLTTPELEELRRLLGARQVLAEQSAMIEQRVELLVLAARDRRGIQGPVRVRPETGEIAVAEPGGGEGT